MKTNRFAHHIIAALGLAALALTGYAESTRPGAPVLPPRIAMMTITVTNGAPAPATVAMAEWADIKDYTHDTRVQFFAGFKRLETRVDGQISELIAKRATMKGTTGTKEWDFSMKEMEDARAYLKFSGEVLSKATPETWDQQKDKVGLAWVRTQAAYDKVKSSTTS